MNVLSKLWKSIGNLADSFNGLAGVIDAAAGRLRQSLALEHGAEAAADVIDQPAAAPEGNGRGRKAVGSGR